MFDYKILRSHEWNKINLGGQIVFTNGCFDILHPGHLNYLYKASEIGEKLILGLNSDRSISQIKGNNRPINDFSFRSKMLSYLSFIDQIIEFDDETPLELIRRIKPSYLIKGSDYYNKSIVGEDLVKENGGQVILLDYVEGYSTTSIIQSIIQKID